MLRGWNISQTIFLELYLLGQCIVLFLMFLIMMASKFNWLKRGVKSYYSRYSTWLHMIFNTVLKISTKPRFAWVTYTVDSYTDPIKDTIASVWEARQQVILSSLFCFLNKCLAKQFCWFLKRKPRRFSNHESRLLLWSHTFTIIVLLVQLLW